MSAWQAQAQAVMAAGSRQRGAEGGSPAQAAQAPDFAAWQALLEQRSGVVLAEQSRGFLQLALDERIRALGGLDYAGYYRLLCNDAAHSFEWSQFLSRLTVQETRFFRNRTAFDLLAQYLPERRRACGERALMLWSIGCASGEEAYSMAITASEALPAGTDSFVVLGSDISATALAKARSGCYSARRMATVSEALRQRYFQAQPADAQFCVTRALAAQVCFTRLNVLELAQEPFFNLDVIFCQNLLIYFRRNKRLDLLNQLTSRLASGGLLVIGGGEAALWQHPQLTAVACPGEVQAFVRRQEPGAE